MMDIFKRVRDDYRSAKWPIWFSVLTVSAFAMVYWVVQWTTHPEESGYLTTIFKYYDYTYFNVLSRSVSHLFSDSLLYDPGTNNVLPYSLTGILPYSIFAFFFGSGGFVVGDVFTQILRLAAFWFLLGVWTKSPKERIFLALAMFFASSEYVLGEWNRSSIFQGIWGVRVPRPGVTSSYFLFSLGVVLRLPKYLNQKLSIPSLIMMALPFALLNNGDIYSFLAVGMLCFVLGCVWIARREVPVLKFLLFGLCVVALCAPLFIHMNSIPKEILLRMGQYPVEANLATIEIPTRLHIVLLVLSAIGVTLAVRLRPQDKEPLQLVFAMVGMYFLSFTTSIFVGALSGKNILEYQYAIRRDQFASFLGVVFAFYLVSILIRKRENANKVWLGIALVAGTLNFYHYVSFSSDQANKIDGPEPSYMLKMIPKWRESADQVYKFVESRSKDSSSVVIGTFDKTLMILLTMNPKIYTYAMAYQTSVPNPEIFERFFLMAAMTGISDQTMINYLLDRETHYHSLTYATFQLNRVYVTPPIQQYPPEALAQIPYYRDNWGLFVPPEVNKQLFAGYQRTKERFMQNPSAYSYRQPDYLILNKVPELDVAPANFQLALETPAFKVFERRK